MYYSPNHPSYQKMPPIHPQCREMAKQTIEFIYPQNTNQIYLPKDIDQKVQSVVIKVAHSQKNAKIFWHLNHEYLGTTQFDHQMEISPTVGKHTLTLVDEEGNTTTKIIECIGRGDN